MKLNKILNSLKARKWEIDALGKLPVEVLQKVNYKLRLDWNYYSNKMEGGTLTIEETRSVMVGNITVNRKPLKDLMEMNGHDSVVREILKMGQGKVSISEKRIKDVHTAIMAKDENEEQNKQIGKWKERPNEIINYKGEKITFTLPEEVPAQIHDLLNTTNAQLDAHFADNKNARHPLLIAADFHLGYVNIHPFFDGNGRTGRIFMNLILIACGYPPAIIADDDKAAYYQYLADIQAYGGNPDLFYAQLAGLVQRSQLLILETVQPKMD